MELAIVWGSFTLLSLLITTFTVGIGWGILTGAIVGIAIFMWRVYIEDCYDDWKMQKYPGDHPYLEWKRCKDDWRKIMEEYKEDTYCKISFNDFYKYFSVNPSRYELGYSHAICTAENDAEIIMIFPKRDLHKFFVFRKDYLQKQRMIDVINVVQQDIDKMREDAQEQIDRAKAMLNTDFKKE